MSYLLSFVILVSSIPIIKSLIIIEQNTRILQRDTAELVDKVKKVESVYNRFTRFQAE